jgi:hypothetical protein
LSDIALMVALNTLTVVDRVDPLLVAQNEINEAQRVELG